MATTPAPTTQIVSVVSSGAISFRRPSGTFSRSTWAPAIYEPRARKDGVITYRRIFLGEACWSASKAADAARSLAESKGLPFVDGVKHGTPLFKEE